MKLTLEHFLELLDELPKEQNFDYVNGGSNKICLIDVDKDKKTVNALKVNVETGDEKSANISTERLDSFVNKVVENVPLHIESVWNGSGSGRSAWEGLFAHTSEFYIYHSNKKKHLVWAPSSPHKAGEMQELSAEQFDDLNPIKTVPVSKMGSKYRPYITAIKSKPFLLLAGISGTGKSRIARELARACWDMDSDEFKAQKPMNFEMVQVKPNWHDSSELIGYVSRISETPTYVAGDFLKFVAKAWENLDIPFFLCLDEMNLAPVEQYFAEYLSVVESRKADGEGNISSDPILRKADEQWYFNLTAALTEKEEIRNQFNNQGITLPQNLIVVGTVNMDETTFSFSRKVLDRAMTIEMNDVNLRGGLTERYEMIGKLGKADLIADSVEGVDVYDANSDVCEIVLEYLQSVNDVLDGTPFKVAYRTRNEFLLYVVNNLPYNKNSYGGEMSQKEVIARALDEITSMKILSRIEGDDTKVSNKLLNNLSSRIKDGLTAILADFDADKSITLTKIDEMQKRLETGYTSFWS